MRFCSVIAALSLAALSLRPASARAQTSSDATAVAPDALAEARRRHAAGRSLLEANPPDYNAALAEFQRAYDLLEGHPRRYLELSNIGRCYQGLGQYDRAMEYYERYLREGGAQAEDRAQRHAVCAEPRHRSRVCQQALRHIECLHMVRVADPHGAVAASGICARDGMQGKADGKVIVLHDDRNAEAIDIA